MYTVLSWNGQYALVQGIFLYLSGCLKHALFFKRKFIRWILQKLHRLEAQTHLVVVFNTIDNYTVWKITTLLFRINTSRMSRMLWPYSSRERTQNLLSFNKVSIRLLKIISEGVDWTMKKSIQHQYDCPALWGCRLQFPDVHW